MRFWIYTALLCLCAVKPGYAEQRSCSYASVVLLEALIAQGDLDAQVYLGNKLVFGPCPTEARARGLDYLYDAAERGHPEAQFRLGALMVLEADAPHNDGMDYIERAAEADLIEAQEFLGLFLLEQARDEAAREIALYWFGRAADQGSAHAAMLAHTVYKLGLHGVPQDDCIAGLWAETAKRLAHPKATASEAWSQNC